MSQGDKSAVAGSIRSKSPRVQEKYRNYWITSDYVRVLREYSVTASVVNDLPI